MTGVLAQRGRGEREMGGAAASARAAQRAWAAQPLPQRLAVVRRFRHALAARSGELAAALGGKPSREVLAGELLPLAEACRFLERRAARVLRARRPPGLRPSWPGRIAVEIRREPLGLVLVLAPSNGPLFLPGATALQALAAGNAVWLGPARGGGAAAAALAGVLRDAGLPPGVLRVLPAGAGAARDAIAAGPDKVFFTGSVATGRVVLADLGARLIPAVAELSGCDAAFVLADADLALAARALRFGLCWNDGATCIAPRRVLVERALAEELEQRLVGELTAAPAPRVTARLIESARMLARAAVAAGARLAHGELAAGAPAAPIVLADVPAGAAILAADLLAPVLSIQPVDGAEDALQRNGQCPFALGAAIFGGERSAFELARRVPAGIVTVNDVVAPTADPRVPFGGRGRSGYGVTRGAEGLLETTAAKAILVARGGRRHLAPARDRDAALLQGLLRALHGGSWRARLGGVRAVIAAARRRVTSMETAGGGDDVR